ncbi:MAG: DUF3048 domain-containing protein [Actinobacteria bacterium]|nr:DUF3048 domain-containing protein [Actinomycetota bacterium]
MTARGKVLTGLIAALVVAGAGTGAFLALSGDNPGPGETASPGTSPTDGTTVPPTTGETVCPLSGEAVEGVPDRPALIVKVEEAPQARPQAGLNEADVVVEQPVEGNITRLFVVFHCHDAERVGPVRSARFVDPNLAPQFGTPLFGYSGAAPPVVQAVGRGDLVDVSYEGPAVGSYARDPSRESPHNLFTSTGALYEAGAGQGGRPDALYPRSDKPTGGKKATTIHLPFQVPLADITWTWSKPDGAWLRSIGGGPHLLEDGEQIRAANVIVQQVEQEPTEIVDAGGNRSYEVIVIGTGKAYVFRNGKMIVGTWVKDSLSGPTRYLDADGNEIELAPGTTWIELYGNQSNTLRFQPS